MKELDAAAYTIGWISALPEEYLAAQVFLDEDHGQPKSRSPNDTNSYWLGSIGQHNVVIAVLPKGEYGTASAAGVAVNLLRSFPNVRIGLMVGIGGGAPQLPDHDIRLGDVVVSSPENGHGGVLQYDFGKAIQEKKFQYTRSLDQPPQALLTALAGLSTQHDKDGNRLPEAVDEVLKNRPRLKRKYGRPSPDTDLLFKSDVVHGDGSCSSTCGKDSTNTIARREREPDIEDDLAVHYGTIASGNSLMKDAILRDRLAAEQNALCFEMEAAGLMNRFPCLAVRGICDYSDSHKSKEWQGFAAMVAAAYAKDLICYLAPELVQTEQKLSSILSDIQEVTTETKVIVQGIQSRQDAQEKQAILDWLIDTNFGAQQSDVFAGRQPGTCQWLLNSSKYRNWVENGDQTLYCPGIPGAGKTILSSILINDLETKFEIDSTVGIAYIYCNFRNQQSQDIRMLVASVLKQLCQRRPDIPDAIQAMYRKHGMAQTKPPIEELRVALRAAVKLFSRVYLVVDALDEWQNTEGARSSMLNELLVLQAETHLNLFATSRPVGDIKRCFSGLPSIDISASQEDIALYVEGHQNLLPEFVGQTSGLLDKIKETLSEASQGMFLIAQLYLEWLKSEVSVRGLEDTLAQFLERSKHDGLDQILCKAYDETMARISEQNARRVELARHVLSWISFAKRRLSIIEVQHAIAVKHGDKDFNAKGISDAGLIISVCCGLVTVDEESSVIRLVHYTTDEYFKSNEARLFPDVHGYLTRQCIFYLSLEGYEKGRPALEDIYARHREVDTRNPTCQLEEIEFADIENEQQEEIVIAQHTVLGDWVKEYPFCSYAAHNWGLHARVLSQHARNEAIEMTLPFINNKKSFDNALQLLCFGMGRYEFPRITDRLNLAVYHGLDFLIEDLTRNWDAETCGQEGRKALILACERGHAATVELLFLKLATMEVDIVDWWHNPLHSAAEGGHSDVIKVLLKLGMSTDTCEWDEETAIKLGIREGHSDALIPLLDAIGSPEQQISYAKERGLMKDAIEERNTAFAQILLNRGLDVNDRVKNESPHLTVALSLGQIGMANWFLEKGAKLLRNDKGVTALMLASEAYGSGREIDFLVGIGADLDEQDESGRTALMCAVDSMTQHHVVALLKHGADLSLQDQHGDTVFHKACRLVEYGRYHRRDIVEMLLEAGADVNVKNLNGQTPVAAAMEQNQPTIARLVIESGADVDWQDNRGQSLLMKTIEKHDHITSKMIIERSKDLDLQDEDGWTALDYAFEAGYHVYMSEGEAIVWLLLERGAKANVYPEAMENTCGLEALFEDFRPED